MNHKSAALSRGDVWPWLIIGLAVFIYGHSLSNGFVWDDADFLLHNPSLGSLKGLSAYWTPSDYFFTIPLTASLLWLQHQFWGLAPWGYHAISLAFHVFNALLLFRLLRRLASPLAGVVALLFAIHPIQVETVAWIAEQKNIFSFFFFMLTFHAFLDFDSSNKKRDCAKTLLYFMAALLSKSIAVCFVMVPLLYEWWKRGSVCKRNILLSLSFLCLGALSVISSIHQESFYSSSVLSKILFPEKILLVGKNFFFYIKQIALPWRFSAVYPPWDIRIIHWENWIFPVAVVVLYFALFRYRSRLGRGPFTLLCFYGASIFPALGFLKISLLSLTHASDHLSYLSVPPILLLLCSAIQGLLPKIKIPSGRGILKPSASFMGSIAVLAVLYLSLISFRLTLNYKDDVVFFSQLLDQYPGSIFANTRLGMAYERVGFLEKAKQIYLKGSFGVDFFTQASRYRDIARICVIQKKPQEALFFLEKSQALRSRRGYLNDYYDYYLLGSARFHSGNFKEAAEAFRMGIAKAPDWVKNYEGLGASLMNLGDVLNALKAFQESCRLNPGDKNAKDNFEYAKKMLAKQDPRKGIS
ncbi:MAG: tetratricopeptide repeat protein [Candidatus Omnitrophota bacterium]